MRSDNPAAISPLRLGCAPAKPGAPASARAAPLTARNSRRPIRQTVLSDPSSWGVTPLAAFLVAYSMHAMPRAVKRGTVEAVDPVKRRVTLKGSEGKSRTMKVDPSVKRLDEVKKGDQIVVRYTEAIAFSVRKA